MAKATPVEGLTPDTPLDVALRRLLLARLADLVRYRDRLLSGLLAAAESPAEDLVELVHDARVASRRLRAVFGLTAPHDRLRQAAEQVAGYGSALGEVRDLDITLHWLETHGLQADAVEQAGIGALHRQVAAQRDERRRWLGARTQEFFAQSPQTLEEAAAALHTDGGRMGGGRVWRRLQKRLRRMAERLKPALSGQADFVHELRIAAKKLRYHAELLDGVVTAAGHIVKELTPLQESLGELHDSDVRLHWLPVQIAAAERVHLPGLALLLRATLAERQGQWASLHALLLSWQHDDRLGELARLQ